MVNFSAKEAKASRVSTFQALPHAVKCPRDQPTNSTTVGILKQHFKEVCDQGVQLALSLLYCTTVFIQT